MGYAELLWPLQIICECKLLRWGGAVCQHLLAVQQEAVCGGGVALGISLCTYCWTVSHILLVSEGVSRWCPSASPPVCHAAAPPSPQQLNTASSRLRAP